MSEFIQRHIGPSESEQRKMLADLGLSTIDELVREIVPDSILLRGDSRLPEGCSEQQALTELKDIASHNIVKRSLIGQGYYGTITPPVIQRNVFENPAWYTSYTPYQAEISQGRLEALFNYQTLITELTGLPVANASLLDEGTAAAEAMLLAHSQSKKKDFIVDDKLFPQTLEVLQTRAKPLGINIIKIDFDKSIPIAFFTDAFGVIVQLPNSHGNLRHRSGLLRLAEEEAALNRMGFNNNGAENLVKNFVEQGIEFKKDRKNICLGINFGKSKITDLSQAKDDYLTSLKLLIPYCDYAAINVSSPNTEGLRKLQDPILLKELLKEIKNLPNCPPLFVKIAPDLSLKDIDDICQLIIEENIDGIIAINTSIDRLGLENRKIMQTGLLLSEENGGLSGRPLQKKANQIIKHIHNIDKKIILIGVGGINSPESAWERICSGASLIQLYTGWIYKGPQLVPDILEGIIKQLNNHQLSSIKDAIGSDLKWVE